MKNNNVSKKRNELTIFVSNVSEDVLPFIEAMTDPIKKEYEINENANLADLQLFSCADEDDLVFISPVKQDADLINYYKSLFNPKYLEVLVPKIHTGKTCIDTINDKNLINTLKSIKKNYRKVTLLSYTASYEFYQLVKYLNKEGFKVYTPEAPLEECAWTVNFYGSKSGIRQLAQRSLHFESDFVIADGLICMGIYDAAKIAADKYISEDGVVIKTNKGHSGAGVLIFREGDLPKKYSDCEKAIVKILETDKYWSQFPIIIEDLVNVNPSIAGGFPNVEFKIQKSGEINFLYCCGLRVTKDGIFQGTEIGDEIISQRYLARLIDLGFYVGEQYASEGYRGYFDVDFIAGKNYKIYVSESNTRRTGGTHAYKTALKLAGKDFLDDVYIIHENVYKLDSKINISFRDLLNNMNDILFNQNTKEGVVFPSANLLKQNRLSYIVIGKNEKRAIEIEEDMKYKLEEMKI